MALMEAGRQCPTVQGTIGSDEVNSEQHHKPLRGSDCGLQPVHMKTELGVIVHQHGTVNYKTVVVLTAHHGLGGWGIRSVLHKPRVCVDQLS